MSFHIYKMYTTIKVTQSVSCNTSLFLLLYSLYSHLSPFPLFIFLTDSILWKKNLSRFSHSISELTSIIFTLRLTPLKVRLQSKKRIFFHHLPPIFICVCLSCSPLLSVLFLHFSEYWMASWDRLDMSVRSSNTLGAFVCDVGRWYCVCLSAVRILSDQGGVCWLLV